MEARYIYLCLDEIYLIGILQIFCLWYLKYLLACCRVTDDGVQTRAHLEAQFASSLALRSPNEYRSCLLSYVRFLARLVTYFMPEILSLFFFGVCTLLLMSKKSNLPPMLIWNT